MKKFKKFLVLVIFAIAIFSSISFTASAISSKNNADVKEAIVLAQKNTNANDQNNKSSNNSVLSKNNALRDKMDKQVQHKKSAEEKLAAAESTNKEKKKSIEEAHKMGGKIGIETAKGLNNILDWYKDNEGVEDPDIAGHINDVVDMAANIASVCGPYGAAIAGAIKLTQFAVNAIINADEPTSAAALQEQRMNAQFDALGTQIAELSEQMTSMANQLTEATNEITSKIEYEFETDRAINRYYDFAYKGDNGYSFVDLETTLFGEKEEQLAYNAQLKNAIMTNANQETLKFYYDQLYDTLIDYRNSFYKYVLAEDEITDPIILYYYQALSASDKIDEVDALYATILFANRIYNAAFEMEECITKCYNYQVTYLAKQEFAAGNYINLDDPNLFYSTPKHKISLYTISLFTDEIYNKINSLDDVMIKYLAKIYGITTCYAVKYNDSIFEMYCNEEKTCYVASDQTIYLNQFLPDIMDLFGFDVNMMKYTLVTGNIEKDIAGYFNVTSQELNYANTFYVKVYYDDIYLGCINFKIGISNDEFSGGDGSKDNPYLISTSDQFMNIGNDLTANYKLINNIDLDYSMEPFGYNVSGDQNPKLLYNKFTGILDGNGFEICGLIMSNKINVGGELKEGEYTGLFARIGEGGVVKNLIINSPQFYDIEITEATLSSKNFYCGIIAGENLGTITNCKVYGHYTNSQNEFLHNIEYNLDVTTSQVSVNSYIGGICGINKGYIKFITVSSFGIDGKSINHIGADTANRNQNAIYIGAIAGSNQGIVSNIISEDNNLKVYGEHNSKSDSPVTPYIIAYAGGLFGTNSNYAGTSNTYVKNIVLVADDKPNVNPRVINGCKDGKHKHEGNEYVPEIKDDQKENIKGDYQVINSLIQNENKKIKLNEVTLKGYTKHQTLEYISQTIDFTNIVIMFNNQEFVYRTGERTGNNTYNISLLLDFTPTKKLGQEMEVTAMGSLEYNNESYPFFVKIKVDVRENYVKSIVVNNYQTEYSINEKLPISGISITKTWINGVSETVENQNVSISLKDSDTKYDYITKTKGIKTLQIKYKVLEDELIYEQEIYVTCYCDYANKDLFDSTKYTYLPAKSTAHTCTTDGINYYQCNTCCETHGLIFKACHTIAHQDEVESTCTVNGHSEYDFCSECHKVLTEKTIYPLKEHTYVVHQNDDSKHYCTVCNKIEKHNYQITSTIQNGNIYYLYECADCRHKYSVIDDNTYTEEYNSLPKLVVTNEYARSGGDVVRVLVQIINNPGITSASFGVRYDRRLKLLRYEQNYDVINSTSDGLPVEYGYNFVWASANALTGDTTLLYLDFEVPKNAKLNDVYNISCVYQLVEGNVENGFGIGGVVKELMTVDGSITIVEHVPGDADGDGKVTVKDAAYICKYTIGVFTGDNEEDDAIKENISKYCDVDFSNGISAEDASLILKHISGKVDGIILSKYYRIRVITNNDDDEIEYYWVDLNNTENNELPNNTFDYLPELNGSKYGYTIEKWSYDILGENVIDLESNVQYRSEQKIQTIYAQWVKNRVVFDTSDSNNGTSFADLVYNGNDTFNLNDYNSVAKTVYITFHDTENIGNSDRYGAATYDMDSWTFYERSLIGDISWNSDKFWLDTDNPGVITAKISWGAGEIVSLGDMNIAWHKPNYDAGWDWSCKNANNYDIEVSLNNLPDYSSYNETTGYYCMTLNATWNNPTTYSVYYDFNSHGNIDGLYREDDIFFGNEDENIEYFYENKQFVISPNSAVDLLNGRYNKLSGTVNVKAVLYGPTQIIYLHCNSTGNFDSTDVSIEITPEGSDSGMQILFNNGPYKEINNIWYDEDHPVTEVNIRIYNSYSNYVYIDDFWIASTTSVPLKYYTDIEEGLLESVVIPGGWGIYPFDLYYSFEGYYMLVDGVEHKIYDNEGDITDYGRNYTVTSDIHLYAKWE